MRKLLLLSGFVLALTSCQKRDEIANITKSQKIDDSIYYATGYLPTDPSVLSRIPEYQAATKGVEAIESLPSSYIIPDLPMALNQGYKGSCVAYAVAHARTIINSLTKTLSDGSPNLNAYASGDYLFEKYKSNMSSCSNGVFFVSALDALKADGACSYAEMPLTSCGTTPTADQEKTFLNSGSMIITGLQIIRTLVL